MADIDNRLLQSAHLNYREMELKISIHSWNVYVSVLGRLRNVLRELKVRRVWTGPVWSDTVLVPSCSQTQKAGFTTVAGSKPEQPILTSSEQNVDLTSTGGYDTIIQYLNDGKRTCKEVEEFMKAR